MARARWLHRFQGMEHVDDTLTLERAAPPREDGLLVRIWRSWAFRSVLVGALAVALDLSLGLTLRAVFGVPDRFAAMAGVVTGATFTYFANRAFSFKDTSRIRDTLWRFAVVIITLSVIHGQVLVLIREHLAFSYVVAKFSADLLVLTVPQILLMKYWVFRPRVKPLTPEPGPRRPAPHAAGEQAPV